MLFSTSMKGVLCEAISDGRSLRDSCYSKSKELQSLTMIMDKTIAVVVPAYNEERLIYGTLTTIPTFVDQIIVVDDASTDETERLIGLAIQGDRRIRWVKHCENRGVGAAIVSGYQAALDCKADIIAVMAGDGQMDAGDLYRIVEPVAMGEVDYAKGNRFIMPAIRYFGGLILSWLTSVVCRTPILDSQSGYTAISRSILEQVPLNKLYPRYGFPNDILIKLSKVGARIKNVQTAPVYGNGEQSGIKIHKVIWPILGILGRGAWQRISPLRLIKSS